MSRRGVEVFVRASVRRGGPLPLLGKFLGLTAVFSLVILVFIRLAMAFI